MRLLPQRSELSVLIIPCRFIGFSQCMRTVGCRLPEAVALKAKIDDLGSKVRQLKSDKKSKVCTEPHVLLITKCNQLNTLN